ncbi:MAG TPA: urea carboxylase-associated family protein [Thermoleophilaceae bacterium]|nr:urea carboxylase-associated family protein [Thermoleophilaceae bacterium]
MRTTETIHVGAREGRAVTVPAGGLFRVIDLEGRQVADMFAFNAEDVSEHHSAMHTRAAVDRLFPRVGEHFYTNRRRPILKLERDDSPAVHDMLIAPCDPERYEGLGVEGWHASCRENLEIAMRELGHDHICIPASVNLFMNIPVGADGGLGWEPAPTRPGDSITLRAEMDAVVVVSACPQDIVPINDRNPTAVAIELLED